MKKIVVGTRGSKLALWQADWVKKKLSALKPGLEIDIEIIKTEGDQRHDLSPDAFGKEGIFTAELDRALQDQRIDMAVHSLKDLPTRLPQGLVLAAATERASVRDVFILRQDLVSDKVNKTADPVEIINKVENKIMVGTSSLRRIAQLKNRFPHLECAPMRGNLDTRIRKLGENQYDAIIVAEAGLDRLGIDTTPHLRLPLPPSTFLPAAGQGSLAIETRDNGPGREMAELLNHEPTNRAVTAERTAMSALGAGCRVPAGFLGEAPQDVLFLKGVVAHPDGQPLIRAEVTGPSESPEVVGRKLAEKLLDMGAADILKEVRR